MEHIPIVEIVATLIVLVAGAAAALLRLCTAAMNFATSIMSFFKNFRNGD